MLNKVKKIAPILLIVIVIAAAAFVYLRVAAPTGVQAHPGDSEVSLSWNAANVAGYNVEYMPEDGRWSTTNATLNSCTITGLSNGTVYTFRINAIGKNGLVSSYSAMVSATPRPVVETPTAQPKGGEVNKDTKVALTTATDGAVIYYTTDGSTPTKDSNRYCEPITLNANMIISAIAIKDEMIDSKAISEYYYLRISDYELGSVDDMWGHTYNVTIKYKPTVNGPTKDYEYVVTCDGYTKIFKGTEEYNSFFPVLLAARKSFYTDKAASKSYADQAYKVFIGNLP